MQGVSHALHAGRVTAELRRRPRRRLTRIPQSRRAVVARRRVQRRVVEEARAVGDAGVRRRVPHDGLAGRDVPQQNLTVFAGRQ